MLVTTSFSPTSVMVEEAVSVAARLSWRYVQRMNDSLVQLRKRHQALGAELLVLTDHQWRWYPRDTDKPVFFHPSMAHVRIKRLLREEEDVLLRVANMSEGESVLDCTAGMGADAIVFAHASGASGRVTALESSPALAFILENGLRTYHSQIQPVEAAMRRIHVVADNHESYLRSLPSRSVDVVYFDPMFRKPLPDSNVLELLRTSVNAAPLQVETIQEAIRVARRLVLLKETRGSHEFARLGFTLVTSGSGKIAYGVIRV